MSKKGSVAPGHQDVKRWLLIGSVLFSQKVLCYFLGLQETFFKELYGILTPFYFPGTTWLICFLYLLEFSDTAPYTAPCWQQRFIVWNSIELHVASLHF